LTSFNAVLEIPQITDSLDVERVLVSSGSFSAEDLKFIRSNYNSVASIKSLLTISETARQGEGKTLGERFIDHCLHILPQQKDLKSDDF